MSKRTKTFTFVELMVALTLFSIIAVSIYHTLRTGLKMYTQGNTVIADNQKLRLFFDTLSRDLANSVDFRPYVDCQWGDDSISFSALVGESQDGRLNREFARISYVLDRDKLVRKYASRRAAFKAEKAEEQILLENVDSVSFAYAYQSEGFADQPEWLGEWDFKDDDFKLPRGVRITLTFKSEGESHPEVFTKTVLITLGKLGSRISG